MSSYRDMNLDEKLLLKSGLPLGDPFPVTDRPCRHKMDQNESPLDLPPDVKNRILQEMEQVAWNRYPQPAFYSETKRIFADSFDIPSDMLAITAGCDQAIQGIHFVAGGPGRKALVFTPTYPMLHHASLMSGTPTQTMLIGPEYEIDLPVLSDYRLVLLANPNNPTGGITNSKIIQTMLLAGVMLFLDEAYYDFSKETYLPFLSSYPNLCIGRSFSKIMIAGIRLGALIGHPQLIRAYESLITAPYHLGCLQLIVARMYKNLMPFIRKAAQEIISERSRVEDELKRLKILFYPSQTNFILFKIRDSKHFYEYLLSEGIRIRDMSHFQSLMDHLRVTIGTPEQNDAFLKAFADYINLSAI